MTNTIIEVYYINNLDNSIFKDIKYIILVFEKLKSIHDDHLQIGMKELQYIQIAIKNEKKCILLVSSIIAQFIGCIHLI